MFVITNHRGLDVEGADPEIERLMRLAADLSRLKEGVGPTEAELRNAPIIDHWMPGLRPVRCLLGEVSGHPLLPGTGRSIATSDLWVIAEHHGWARTLSRWYRLGRPRGAQPNDS